MKQIKQVEHLSQMKSMCLNIYMYMYMYSKKNKVYPKKLNRRHTASGCLQEQMIVVRVIDFRAPICEWNVFMVV